MCVGLIRLAYGKLALGETQPYRVLLLLVWELPEVRYVEPPTERHTYIHTLTLGSPAVRRCPHFPVGAFPLLKKITGKEGDRTSDVSRPSTMASPTCTYMVPLPTHAHTPDRQTGPLVPTDTPPIIDRRADDPIAGAAKSTMAIYRSNYGRRTRSTFHFWPRASNTSV